MRTRLPLFLILLSFLSCVAGCASSKEHDKRAVLREGLLGQWSHDRDWIVFSPGGLLGRFEKGAGSADSYKLVDDKRIEIEEPGKEGESKVWNVDLDGDVLKLTFPDGKTASFERSDKPAAQVDEKLLGLWGSASVGEGRENLMEFTRSGIFLAQRWISPVEGGEKYKVGETGTFESSGSKLTLNGVRQHEFRKSLTYTIKGTDLEMTGMWKDKAGNPTSRTYHRR